MTFESVAVFNFSHLKEARSPSIKSIWLEGFVDRKIAHVSPIFDPISINEEFGRNICIEEAVLARLEFIDGYKLLQNTDG
jgi:hypothetical protein